MERGTYEERLSYLRVPYQHVFDILRRLNQQFYSSGEWKRLRDYVIARDNGCDIALPDRVILGPPVVHHMVPLLPEDFAPFSLRHASPPYQYTTSCDFLLDPDFLITVSRETHERIHGSGVASHLPPSGDRKPGDTKLW